MDGWMYGWMDGWTDGVRRDAERLGIKNWRTKAMCRDVWRRILESAGL
jgi:hypothetical protein